MNKEELSMLISPVDGRYNDLTKDIREYISEYALIKARVETEIKWIIRLFKTNGILTNETDLKSLTKTKINALTKIITDFSLEDVKKVKEYEAVIKHDVKAVEYFLREKFNKLGLEGYIPFIHFGCTSEDVNSMSYAKMFTNTILGAFCVHAKNLINKIDELAILYKDIPMLGHTHGQAASPTTLGKEFKVFAARLTLRLRKIEDIKFPCKFSGAVGNFNAHYVAFPNINWYKECKKFVENEGLSFNSLTTQIEPHDVICEVICHIKLLSNVIKDFDNDIWLYTSIGYLKQKIIENEVGSSVMPNKINPILFENSMANVNLLQGLANAITDNLQVSKMQRDLVDSSTLRSIGMIIAYAEITIKQCIKGLKRIEPNTEKMLKDLQDTPQVLAEAIQTILRKNGYADAYEKLKALTRGKEISLEELRKFALTLEIEQNDMNMLLNLTPESYIGIASKLAELKLEEL